MGWRRDVLPAGAEHVTHVWPEGDLVEHDLTALFPADRLHACVCGPRWVRGRDGTIRCQHHALDGRARP